MEVRSLLVVFVLEVRVDLGVLCWQSVAVELLFAVAVVVWAMTVEELRLMEVVSRLSAVKPRAEGWWEEMEVRSLQSVAGEGVRVVVEN